MKTFIKLSIIAIVAILFAVGFFLGGIVKTGIATVGSDVTKVKVTVDDVSINAFGGSASISNLQVGNPEGFESDYAFLLGNITVDINLKSLLSDTIVINNVYINNPKINYEFSLSGANINKINSNISADSEASNGEEEATQETSGSSKKVIISNLYIKGATVSVGLAGKKQSIKLGDIHLKNIGQSEDGTSIASATKDVMTAITKQLSKANISGFQNQLKDMGKNIGKSFNGLKNMF